MTAVTGWSRNLTDLREVPLWCTLGSCCWGEQEEVQDGFSQSVVCLVFACAPLVARTNRRRLRKSKLSVRNKELPLRGADLVFIWLQSLVAEKSRLFVLVMVASKRGKPDVWMSRKMRWTMNLMCVWYAHQFPDFRWRPFVFMPDPQNMIKNYGIKGGTETSVFSNP